MKKLVIENVILTITGQATITARIQAHVKKNQSCALVVETGTGIANQRTGAFLCHKSVMEIALMEEKEEYIPRNGIHIVKRKGCARRTTFPAQENVIIENIFVQKMIHAGKIMKNVMMGVLSMNFFVEKHKNVIQ